MKESHHPNILKIGQIRKDNNLHESFEFSLHKKVPLQRENSKMN